MLAVEQIRGSVRAREFRLTTHAETEREADTINLAEIEEAFGSSDCEILEAYPDDPPGASCLSLGFTRAGDPLHAVLGTVNELLVFVTIYRPEPRLWENWRIRSE